MMKRKSKIIAIALGLICSVGILAVPASANAAEITRPTATGVRFDANGDGRVSVLDLIRAWKEYSYTRVENPEQAPAGFVYCTTDMLTSGKDTVQLSDIKNIRSKFIFNPTVASVQDMITAIPDAEALLSNDRGAVGEAKAAYDALSDSEKASVVNAGKLNTCVAKIKVWDELAAKVVLDASYQVLGYEEKATLLTNVDDNTFEKVYSIKDATYVAVTKDLKTAKASFRESKNIVLYIYNPTDNAVDGNYTMNWDYYGYFRLKANSWNRIEFADFASNDVNKQMISSDATLYFYANMEGEGWKISSFYGLSDDASDVAGEQVVVDAAYQTLGVGNESGNGKTAGLTPGADDADFGKVISVKDATYIAVTNTVKTEQAAFRESDAIAFYIYNPTDSVVNGNYTMDWSNDGHFQLKPNAWNRIFFADFASSDVNKQMINSDATIFFYADMAGEGWKVSSFYGLSLPGANLGAETVDPEAEAIAAVIAQITALPEPTALKLSDKEAVVTAESAYDTLSEAGKAKVENATKLTECIAKIAELENAITQVVAPVEALINALPDPSTIVMPDSMKDLAAIDEAKKAYDTLTSEQQAYVNASTVTKLNGCLTATEGYAVVVNAKTDTLMKAPDAEFAGSIDKETDVSAGPVFAMNITNKANDSYAAGFRIEKDLSNRRIVFSVYNPTQSATELWMYADNWTGLGTQSIAAGWNKITLELTETQATGAIFGFIPPSVDVADTKWLITSFYSVSDDAVAAEKVAKVELLLQGMPSADDITSLDETAKIESVQNARAAYDALGDNTSMVDVTLVEKLVAAEAKIAALESAGQTIQEKLAAKLVVDAGQKNMTVWNASNVSVESQLTVNANDVLTEVMGIPSESAILILEGGRQTTEFNSASKISFWIYNPTNAEVKGHFANDTWISSKSFALAAEAWTRIDVDDTTADKFISGKKTIYFYVKGGAAVGAEGFVVSSMYADLTTDEIAEVETKLAKSDTEPEPELTLQDKLAAKLVVDAGEKNMTLLGSGDANISDTLNVTTNDVFENVLQLPSTGTVLVIEPSRQTTAFNSAENISFWVYNPTESAVSGYYANDSWATSVSFTFAAQAWTKVDIDDTDASAFISSKKTIYFYLKNNTPIGSDGWFVSSMYADLTADEIDEVQKQLTPLADRIAPKMVIDAGAKNITLLGSENANISDTLNVTTNDVFENVLQLPSTGTVLVIEPSRQTTAFNSAEKISFWVYNPTESAVSGYYANDSWASSVSFTFAAQAWTRVDIDDTDASFFISSKKTIYFYLKNNTPIGSDGWSVSSMYADLTSDEIAEVEARLALSQ